MTAPRTPSENYLLWTGVSALIIGGTGFLCGFIGPILLNPDANQGPLLGIFITGPLGALLGAVFGIVAAAWHLSRQTLTATLVVLALATALSTLYFCLPSDRSEAFVIDAETVACDAPTQFLDEATTHWDQWNAQNTWHTPRPGWKESIGDMTGHDRGVVLTMIVHQRWDIYERQKPWNRGRLVSRPGKTQAGQRYFARASCHEHRIGERALYAPKWEASSSTPPDVLPAFLSLYVLEDVPDRYREVLNR